MHLERDITEYHVQDTSLKNQLNFVEIKPSVLGDCTFAWGLDAANRPHLFIRCIARDSLSDGYVEHLLTFVNDHPVIDGYELKYRSDYKFWKLGFVDDDIKYFITIDFSLASTFLFSTNNLILQWLNRLANGQPCGKFLAFSDREFKEGSRTHPDGRLLFGFGSNFFPISQFICDIAC